MPPKKGPRNSMPARINHANNTTLTPSRRSPRVPALSKSSSDSTQSLKSLDNSPTPPESSFNIRFYNPQSPSTPSRSPLPLPNSRAASPGPPSTRRRTFQARPSRLSTVYTPVAHTPDSSQSSRRTRRTAAFERPQQDSDQDFPELLSTTGWTFDQYMGKFGINDDMAPKKTATSTTSNGARSSTRVRKPTTRAVEASQLKGKGRQAKASTPAPATEKAAKPAAGPKGIVKRGTQSAKDKKPSKIALKKLEVSANQAALKLYEVAAFALNDDFAVPTDLPKFIADARAAFEQDQTTAPQNVNGQTTNGVKSDEVPPKKAAPGKITKPVKEKPVKEVSPTRIILKLKKQQPPKLEVDGWTNAGRVNDSGEEVVLTPTDQSPYRSPHTYGDEELPFPPIRARSDRQAEEDNSLGFPPLFGDRNIPINVVSNFEPEDVTEEMARAKARGQKRRQQAPTVDTPAKKPRRKRRQPGARTTAPEPPTATPTAAKSENTQSPVRLKLKLNAPATEDQPPAVESSQRGSWQANAQGGGRLKLKLTQAPVMQEQPPTVDEPATGRGRGQDNGRSTSRVNDRGSTRGNARGSGRGSTRGAARESTRGSNQGSGRGRGGGTERGGERGSAAPKFDRGGIKKPRGKGSRGGRGRGKASD